MKLPKVTARFIPRNQGNQIVYSVTKQKRIYVQKGYSGKIFGGVSNSGELILLDNGRKKIFDVKVSTIENHGEQQTCLQPIV